MSFCYNHPIAEVNLAWWLAWTSNPVVVHRKVGWVGSIPMHLRHFVLEWIIQQFQSLNKFIIALIFGNK